MALLGLCLIVCAGLLITLTGLPAFLILCLLSLGGALCGIVWDHLPVTVFAVLPTRLINLFENDLLQALPLYVWIGVLLDRLPVTAALYQTLRAVFGSKGGGDAATSIAIGGLLGPMNGSVGANVMGLCRSVYPRLLNNGVTPAKAQGLICIASTLGVVIPPSLVLILLGDAMLNAHTIALQGTTRSDRIINTQDIFQGVMIPALVVLAGFLLLASYQDKDDPTINTTAAPQNPSIHDKRIATISLFALIVLLGGVASGFFYAVEAAATGATLLLLYGIIGGHLNARNIRDCLHEAAAATGAIFALLVAATSFTLVLRLLGTDRLIAQWLLSLQTDPLIFLCLVLALITVVALVLDAFEIIFVIIPILAPPLLMRIEDAVWVSVCLLLTLQIAFLLPPVGYALMMTRGMTKPHVPLRQILQAIRPYLLLQAVILISVLLWPHSVHLLDKPRANERSIEVPASKATINIQLQQLLPATDQPELPTLPHR
jgi:tripartite ATP-independent transporter DctM subunit